MDKYRVILETEPDPISDGVDIAFPEARRNNYLCIGCGKITGPTGNPSEDAKELVSKCLNRLQDREHFPPRLFILWLTPSFRERYDGYEPVVEAVHRELAKQQLGDVPMLGSSVAVCLFDQNAHERGGLLYCVASRFLEAKVAIGQAAGEDPEHGVKRILDDLGLVGQRNPNPRRNQFLLAFLPGYAHNGDPLTYHAPEIFRELNERTHGRLHIFGGVSSSGTERRAGSQFCNGHVYTRTAVVALVASHLSYGIGLSQGVAASGKELHVKEVRDDGRTIAAFVEGSPSQVMEGIPEPRLLAVDTITGDRVVLIPRLHGEVLRLQHSIERGATLKVIRPDEKRLQRGLDHIKRWSSENHRLSESQISGLLAISSLPRYQARGAIGLDSRSQLKALTNRFPNVEYAGCYMDGELGSDQMGRAVFGNWSVSELTLADNLSPSSFYFLSNDALAQHTHQATTAKSLNEAMREVLRCVKQAGYFGGLISLVFRDGEKTWIVGQVGGSGLWDTEVKPLTTRVHPGNDILSLVANARKARYVRNAQVDPNCDQVVFRRGRIISFYAIPLQDENGEAIAVLQIDLGDLRDAEEFPPEQEAALNALGTLAEAAINYAIQHEELELSRALDRVGTSCLRCQTVEEAAQLFIDEATSHLGIEGHIRLYDPSRGTLRLVAGTGEYYQVARHHRREISVEEDVGQAARAFRHSKEIVVNHPELDGAFLPLLRGPCAPEVHRALSRVGALAIYPIATDANAKAPTGVVCLSSPNEWFFTPSHLRSLRDIGQRLSFILTDIQHKQAEERRKDELLFLREIRPNLEPQLDVYSALQKQVEKMKEAGRADVVSCYLWEKMQERFVLHAQAGWHDDRWVGAAYYQASEGLTGKLASGGISVSTKLTSGGISVSTDGWYRVPNLPCYFPDLTSISSAWNGAAEYYLQQMFGNSDDRERRYEVIALPLHFKGNPLGIVTLYRVKTQSDSQLGFVTVNPDVLKDAAENLSAFVAALRDHDFTAWRETEQDRLTAVEKVLHEHQYRSITSMLEAACDAVCKEYRAIVTGVYLPDHYNQNTLCLQASRMRNDARVCLPLKIDQDYDPVRIAYRLRQVREQQRKDIGRVNDPDALRKHRAVERVSIPLLAKGECLGALDIHWRGIPRRGDGVPVPHHAADLLMVLGEQIAGALHTLRLRMKNEETHQAALLAERSIAGMGWFLASGLHAQRNNIQRLSSLLRIIRSNDASQERNQPEIEQCLETVDSLRQWLTTTREHGERLTKVSRLPCCLYLLLEDNIRQAHRELPELQIELTCDPGELKGRVILVYRDQITECFSSLINNAVRVVRADLENRWVRVHLTSKREPEDALVVSVIDNGPGLPPDLFERFISAEQVTPDKIAGTGMGLFMASLFCKAHGGTLELDSTIASGTHLKVTLPLQELENKT